MTDLSDDQSSELVTRFQEALHRMDGADTQKTATLDELRKSRSTGQSLSHACAMFQENADALHHEAITIRKLGNTPNLVKNSFVEDGVFRAGVILATERIDNEEAASICTHPSSSNPQLIKPNR